MNRLRRLRTGALDERGSLSPVVVLVVPALVVIVGLVVDSAGKYQTAEHAQQVASSAARAAANSLSGEAVRIGDAFIDTSVAQATAQSYVNASGMTGSVTIAGQVVTVEVETTYATKFLSLIGVNTLPADGAASAQLLTN